MFVYTGMQNYTGPNMNIITSRTPSAIGITAYPTKSRSLSLWLSFVNSIHYHDTCGFLINRADAKVDARLPLNSAARSGHARVYTRNVRCDITIWRASVSRQRVVIERTVFVFSPLRGETIFPVYRVCYVQRIVTGARGKWNGSVRSCLNGRGERTTFKNIKILNVVRRNVPSDQLAIRLTRIVRTSSFVLLTNFTRYTVLSS